jgi:NTE family protein
VSQLLQSTGVPIDRYSFETIEIMKDREEIYGWRRELMILRARLAGKTEAEAEASLSMPKLKVHTMDVSFDAIKDKAERERFMNMPTTFVLPPDDVDRLREIGARLLRESPDFQDLLREWGGTATP